MNQIKLYDESAIITERQMFFKAEMMYLVHTGESPCPCGRCYWSSCCGKTLTEADLMQCDIANDAIWVTSSEIKRNNGQKPEGSKPTGKEDL